MMLAPSIVSSIVSAASAGVSAIAAPAQSASAAAANEPSFGQLMDQLTTGTVDSLKKGEASAIASVHGKISVQQAVDALMSAERTLQTSIAVRDKIVGAYQEISRMAI
jgi:flagellar hook-basal body complex protein FliE